MMNYSFIVPVYNCKDYLSACVQSIRAAGLTDYEILLVDDGSTDGSGAVCDALAEKYPQVRVIHQENGGVSSARNRGIREAKGDYILFVDADDTLLPFDEQTRTLLEQDRVDMLIFGMKFEYCHKGTKVREEILSHPGGVFCLADMEKIFAELFYANYLSSVCNKFFKRSILEAYGIWLDERLINYEDLAFTLEVLARCETIAAVPQACYCYQVDYDHDHTIDRIARIDDLMGNTDIIAEQFMALERAILPEGGQAEQLRLCLLGIYMNLFGVKVKTTPLSGIRRYCRDFREDSYVRRCAEYLPDGSRDMYERICGEKAVPIWLSSRYYMMRHWAVRNVKRMIRRGRT